MITKKFLVAHDKCYTENYTLTAIENIIVDSTTNPNYIAKLLESNYMAVSHPDQICFVPVIELYDASTSAPYTGTWV